MLPDTISRHVPDSPLTTRLRVPTGLVRALMRCTLLLVALTLVADAAEAQQVDSLEDRAAAPIVASVCDKRVVLLGELPSHGEARGFGVKARVVEGLVKRCGFRAVLFEVGSYDFFGLERAIAASPQAGNQSASAKPSGTRIDSLDLALARAIGGFWWTRELAGWRRWLVQEVMAGRVNVGGIDDQTSATGAYARAVLPDLLGSAAPPTRAVECREVVVRYLTWGYTAAVPYDTTQRALLAECSRLAATTPARPSRTAERRSPEEVMLDDAASHFARERSVADRGTPVAPDRELVMAQHVEWWSARLPRDARIVVWTATVHASRAPDSLARGVVPMGARLAERWGDRLAVIGFTALQGQSSRAGRPSQPLAPLPNDALEARALAAPNDAAPWTWLDRAALRALGAVPSRLFGRRTTADWSKAFDGVLVIRDEVAPTFEPRR